MANLIKLTAAVHSHDCTTCVYCGSFKDLDRCGQTDVYFCPSENSLVMRTSSEESDYASFPVRTAELIAVQSPAWAMAFDLYEGRA